MRVVDFLNSDPLQWKWREKTSEPDTDTDTFLNQ